MKKFAGKKLLMLGSNVGSVNMVRYARENGAYVIVADYLDIEHSEAKRYADEAVKISTAEVEGLSQLIVEKKIDAVLAGISEFNLIKAIELSEQHGLPFYCNMKQWESIEHKEQFRELCVKNKVPCPHTYFIGKRIDKVGLNKLSYPLVIKPVDSSASQGVHICHNQEELLENYENAIKSSEKGLIIIEEFVEGNEFTAHYTICNGKATLSSIDNRYPVAVHDGEVTTIPIARVYPSVYIEKYIKNVDSAMVNLCENLGIKNGVLFIQGIYNEKKEQFWIFEGGLRGAGESPNRFTSRISGNDYLKGIVDYVLLGESSLHQEKEDPYMGGKCCGVISFVARHGKVGEIKGLEDAVRNVPSVKEYECRYPVGSITPDTDTLRQLMIRFVMICDSREQMMEDISYLNENICVLNDKGENMVIKLEPERILKEF